MSTAAEIAHAFSAKPSGDGWIARCPLHDDRKASLSINAGSRLVLLHCHALCSQKDLIAEVRRRGYEPDGVPGSRPRPRLKRAQRTQASNQRIRIQLREPEGKPMPEKPIGRLPARRIVATFDYRDEHGQLVYQVVRWHPKDFRQRRPDGRGGWIDNIEGVTRMPYRLPELLASTGPIYIVEGEKDADRLASHGLIATTNSGGAEKADGKGIWLGLAKWFADRRVIIVPDNDESGRQHTKRVGTALTGVVQSIKVLRLPDLLDKGDVSDWLDAGNTIAEFRRLVHQAPKWEADVPPEAGITEPEENSELPEQEDKPGLKINHTDPSSSVFALRDLLAQSGLLFDRGGVLVRLVTNGEGVMNAKEMTSEGVIMAAHEVCQPFKYDKDGNTVLIPLPMGVARMYLDLGEWNLQPLAGISTAPILRPDGSLISGRGYDRVSQIYCDCQIAVDVPERPSKAQAQAALLALRDAFKTFPFADAVMVADGKIQIVDLTQPPGLNESTALAAVLTATCRASLWTAPGVMIVAPHLSGSGAGKGLLLRSVSMIAFGIAPEAFSTGRDAAELDKRIGSALLTGDPVLFLDNANNRTLRSETMASTLTERPSRVRVLGRSKMLRLNCTVFVGLTGNGLGVAEDLVRRLLRIDIDPKMEDPENREFDPGFLNSIKGRRVELLSAALTILRWGRQQAATLKRGIPMGSFEQWAEWVRDPLIELGCQDPALGIRNAKASDPARQEIAEMFTIWNREHGEEAVKAADLNEEILKILNPHKQKTQFVTHTLQRMNGMRHAGFVLKEARRGGRWSKARFILEDHRVLETPEGIPIEQGERQAPERSAQAPERSGRGIRSGAPSRPPKLNKIASFTIQAPETPEGVHIYSRAKKVTENVGNVEEKADGGARPAAVGIPSGVSGVSGTASAKGSDWWRHAIVHVARRDNKKRADERKEHRTPALDKGGDDDG